MKRILLTLFCIPIIVFAQIPPGYYNSAVGLKGNNLKTALYNIIKNHNVITYSGLWTAFQKTDRKPNGKVFDIYSYNPSGPQPYEFTFVTDQCGSYSAESDCFNREHSWPQSWFNSTAGPDSDMFHIYPTDGYVNNRRSNYPYGNVGTVSYVSQNGGKLGPCTNTGYSQTVFEPINEFKGDVARSYFYMSTRYTGEDGAWGTSDATNKATILPWQLNVLMQWHHQDPVSAKEVARNDSIYYLYQNNRNPFIDHPDWADSIWTSVTSLHEQQFDFNNSFSVYPNPSQNQFQLIYHQVKNEQVTYCITSITGKLMEEKQVLLQDHITIDAAEWAPGIYFITLSNGEQRAHLKLIKH